MKIKIKDTPLYMKVVNGSPVIFKKDEINGAFYFFYQPKKERFPLPVGIYSIIGGKIEPIGYFKENFPIVKKQKNNEIKETKVFITKNLNKASIDIHRSIILIDKDYYYTNEVIRKAILYHELGHYYYYDENLCDFFAMQKMREEGFPKSLIAAAFNSVLYSEFRKKHILQNIKKL
jgi:hypothetical protein